MTPTIELLENRCVLSVGWTIGPTVEHAPPDLPWIGTHLARHDTPADSHGISRELTQDWNPVPTGQFVVWHTAWSQAEYRPEYILTTAFAMPEAISVGIGVAGEQVTVWQVTGAALWRVESQDGGRTWGTWQQVASLDAPVSGTATGTLPLEYLESPEPWAAWSWGDPLPAPVPAEVWGVVQVEGVVSFGFERQGQRLVGRYSGALTVEAVEDEFWLQGEWRGQL